VAVEIAFDFVILQLCFFSFTLLGSQLMNTSKPLFYGVATLVALIFLTANSTQAAVILSENFETERTSTNPSTVGVSYTTATSNMFYGTGVGVGVTPGAGSSVTYTNDSTEGITFTGSNFLRYNDVANTGQPSMRSAFTTAPLGLPALTGAWTVSFDYYEPNTAIAGTATHFRLLLGAGDLTVATNRAVDVLFNAANDGIATTGNVNNFNALPAIIPYTTNALHHFDFVGNNSGSSISYVGGTIDDKKFDVYMDGNLILDEVLYENAISSITEVGMGYNSGTGARFQRVFIDNIVVHDVAAVPEPSTFAIAGIVLFGLGFVGAQQRSKTERNS
jgi:hypothetical protein